MLQWLLSILGVAMLAAAAECLIADGAARQALRLIATISLIMALLIPLLHADLFAYASALQVLKETYTWDGAEAEEQSRAMNRTLIESECAAYIVDKGDALHLPVREAHVGTRWDTRGIRVPDHAEIILQSDAGPYDALSDAITTELGIPAEAQEWSRSDEG